MDLFPSSRNGREAYTLLGPGERANLNRWISNFLHTHRAGVSLLSPEDGNRFSFRNLVFSSFYNTGQWIKATKPVYSEKYS
jgi:hypothetical protein